MGSVPIIPLPISRGCQKSPNSQIRSLRVYFLFWNITAKSACDIETLTDVSVIVMNPVTVRRTTPVTPKESAQINSQQSAPITGGDSAGLREYTRCPRFHVQTHSWLARVAYWDLLASTVPP